jgi:hypothetical protein
VPPFSHGLPALRDDPCAYGAAPFSKGEFLATASTGYLFTAPLFRFLQGDFAVPYLHQM